MITKKHINATLIQRLLIRVYKRYQSGAITEAQAIRETNLLSSILKAIAVGGIDTATENQDFQITLNLE